MKTETANAPAHELRPPKRPSASPASPSGRDWRRWGPYVAERQWGAVREDYSADGDAWSYFPVRTGDEPRLSLGRGRHRRLQRRPAAALPGARAVERRRSDSSRSGCYGLTNAQGNHGEDVKELYYYLDGAPSHAYMTMLYKYPQAPIPLRAAAGGERAARPRTSASSRSSTPASSTTTAISTSRSNTPRRTSTTCCCASAPPTAAPSRRGCALLPQTLVSQPLVLVAAATTGRSCGSKARRIGVYQSDDVERELAWDYDGQPLFCENDTNFREAVGTAAVGLLQGRHQRFRRARRRRRGQPGRARHQGGGRCATLTLAPGATATIRLRLRPRGDDDPSPTSTTIVAKRLAETDEFYAALQADIADPDARLVQRQAYAGMLWCKQFYGYDIRRWLAGDPLQPPPPDARDHGRNSNWRHFASGDVDADQSGDILSMPDTWEYPWFAAWDLAFHCVRLAAIDPAFAKSQLTLLTQSRFMHPNGQLPAYEWNFDDVNPPVHAWAALHIYDRDARRPASATACSSNASSTSCCSTSPGGSTARTPAAATCSRAAFSGSTISACSTCATPLPFGGRLDQSDGTAWVAAYALAMMRIALELAIDNPDLRRPRHQVFRAFPRYRAGDARRGRAGRDGLVGRARGLLFRRSARAGTGSDAAAHPLGRRPAADRRRGDRAERPVRAFPAVPRARANGSSSIGPNWRGSSPTGREPNANGDRLLAILRRRRLKARAARMLDETEFLSPYGVRSVSRYHLDHPYELDSRRAEIHAQLRTGRGRDAHLRRQLQLARARSGRRSTSC